MKLYIDDIPALDLPDRKFTIVDFIEWLNDNSPHLTNNGKVMRQAARIAEVIDEFRKNPNPPDWLDIESEDLALIQRAAEEPGQTGYPIRPIRKLLPMVDRISRAQEIAKERAKAENGKTEHMAHPD